MEKEKILEDLRKQFQKFKAEYDIKYSFEEMEEIGFLEDMALSDGYVSKRFSRQLINRLISSPHSWVGELHAWAYPPQMDMIHINEHNQLSEEERKEVLKMIDQIMYFVRKNKRIGFQENVKKGEKEYLIELVEFKKNKFRPFMEKYHKKFEKFWKEELKKELDKQKTQFSM